MLTCPSKLSPSTTREVVKALIEQLPEDDSTTIISVKQDNMPNPPPNGQSGASEPPKYDPSAAYILEFSTILATKDVDSIESMAEKVFHTIQGVLRDASQWHAITVARAVFYALHILKAGYVSFHINVAYLLRFVTN